MLARGENLWTWVKCYKLGIRESLGKLQRCETVSAFNIQDPQRLMAEGKLPNVFQYVANYAPFNSAWSSQMNWGYAPPLSSVMLDVSMKVLAVCSPRHLTDFILAYRIKSF